MESARKFPFFSLVLIYIVFSTVSVHSVLLLLSLPVPLHCALGEEQSWGEVGGDRQGWKALKYCSHLASSSSIHMSGLRPSAGHGWWISITPVRPSLLLEWEYWWKDRRRWMLPNTGIPVRKRFVDLVAQTWTSPVDVCSLRSVNLSWQRREGASRGDFGERLNICMQSCAVFFRWGAWMWCCGSLDANVSIWPWEGGEVVRGACMRKFSCVV